MPQIEEFPAIEEFPTEDELRSSLGGEGTPIPRSPEELAMQNFAARGGTSAGDVRPPGSGIIPEFRAPAGASLPVKVGAGILNTAGAVGNFFLSPEGVATVAAPEVLGAKLARPILKGVFTGLMARGAEEAVKKAKETGNAQDWTEAALAAAGAVGVAIPGRGLAGVEKYPDINYGKLPPPTYPTGADLPMPRGSPPWRRPAFQLPDVTKFEETKPVEPEAPPVVTQGAPPTNDPIVFAAMKGQSGKIYTGSLHPLIEESMPEPAVERGFQTKSGKFIPESEAQGLSTAGIDVPLRGDLSADEIQDPHRRLAYAKKELATATNENEKIALRKLIAETEKEQSPQPAPTEALPTVVEARPPEPAISEAATVGKGKEGVGFSSIEREDGGVLVSARNPNEEVGWAIVKNLGDGVYELNEIRVKESYRKRGIGTSLYTQAANEIAKKGGKLYTSPELTGEGKSLVDALSKKGMTGDLERIKGAHRQEIKSEVAPPPTPPPPIYKSIEGAKVASEMTWEEFSKLKAKKHGALVSFTDASGNVIATTTADAPKASGRGITYYRRRAFDATRPTETPPPAAAKVQSEVGKAEPKFTLTFQQFLDAPREGPLLEALRSLPREPLSPEKLATKERYEKAAEAIEKAGLGWIYDRTSSPSAARNVEAAIRRLPKAKQKIVKEYEDALTANTRTTPEERTAQQRKLYDKAVAAGIIAEPTPAPPAATGEGFPPGPGAQTAGTDQPPGAQIEQLSQAFRQITAEKTPFLQKVKEAFDLGKKRELSQNLIARTLSALKTSGDYLIQTWQGQRELDPILRAKGELSAELETRGWRLRQAIKDMKRAVPSKAVREAISKYVDAGGDVEKLRQSAESVPAGRRAPYIRAMQLTPDEKIIAGHIRSFFDARLQEAMDAGVLSHGVEDYLHRIYPKDTTWRRGVINAVQNALLDTRTPGLAKQRVFQLDAEAERAGHLPVNDFIPRIIDYEASLSKVIASRAAVKRFTEIKMPDGRPMLDVSGIGVPIENAEGIREATLIKPSFRPGEKQLDDNGKPTKNYRQDYQSRDYPALKKWKWATNDAEGKPIFVQGDVLVHPDAVHRVDALLEPSKVKRYAAARAALTVGSVFKQTMLDFSGFHQVQIAIHGLEHKVNPFRLVKDVDTNNPDIQGLLKGGMTLGGQHVGGIYEEGLAGRSLSRQIPGLGELMQSYHDWLFQDFIPRVKTTMAIHALERNKARFAKELASGQMKPEALYHQTAKEANAAFGEQNYIMLERSKTAQDMARLILLAPDFLESRARFALQAGTRLGGEQRMALLLGALTLYTTARIMNKAINDEWHFEPENMFSVIYNGKSYSVRTVQGDILHLMESPVRFWMHRLNPTITRPLFELMTQRDEFGRKRSFWQVLGDTISNVVPISMRNSREQSIWTSMLNAFGGSVRREGRGWVRQ